MISSAKPAYKVPDLSEPSRVCTAVRVSLRYKVVLNNKQISFIADHSFDEISSVEKMYSRSIFGRGHDQLTREQIARGNTALSK